MMSIGPHGPVKRPSSIPRQPYNNVPKSSHHKQSFCLMDISVTILNLNGILMSSKNRKGKRFDQTLVGNSGSSDSDSGSPVTAVVSFSKNVTSSQTSIASHFPSLPLQASGQYSNSNKHRFLASWPKDYDEMGNNLCTFQFTRMMKQEFVADGYNPSSRSAIFVPERVRLTIGLTKGSEIINIGSSSIVLMGDESQSVQMNLPVSLEKGCSNTDIDKDLMRTKSNSNFFSKGVKSYKPTSFAKDPHRKYSIDQNACLKLLVNVRRSESSSNNAYSSDIHYRKYMMEVPSAVRSSRSSSAIIENGSGSCTDSRGSSGICPSGSGSSGENVNPSYIHQPVYSNRLQPKMSEQKKWAPENNLGGKSYSSVSDDDDEENKYSTQYFCGALLDLMSMNELSNQQKQKSMKSFKKLQRKARKRSMDLVFDAASIMPTYRKNDHNASQFIPPSKVYARSYSTEDDSDENAYGHIDSLPSEEEESGYSLSRHDYHSVATEKINNKNELKEMEEARAGYANRIGINPDTMI